MSSNPTLAPFIKKKTYKRIVLSRVNWIDLTDTLIDRLNDHDASSFLTLTIIRYYQK